MSTIFWQMLFHKKCRRKSSYISKHSLKRRFNSQFTWLSILRLLFFEHFYGFEKSSSVKGYFEMNFEVTLYKFSKLIIMLNIEEYYQKSVVKFVKCYKTECVLSVVLIWLKILLWLRNNYLIIWNILIRLVILLESKLFNLFNF